MNHAERHVCVGVYVFFGVYLLSTLLLRSAEDMATVSSSQRIGVVGFGHLGVKHSPMFLRTPFLSPVAVS